MALRDLQHRFDMGDGFAETLEHWRNAVGCGFRDLILLRLGEFEEIASSASPSSGIAGVSAISSAAALDDAVAAFVAVPSQCLKMLSETARECRD